MFKKLPLIIFFTYTSWSLAQINTGNPSKPFGTNTNYEFGILPVGQVLNDSDIQLEYNEWKTKYVENCGETRARVKFDNSLETVSEGIAYGMLLSAYAADKNLFDRLWAYYKSYRNINGVMHWKISGCASVIGRNGATDAELDAAMALIVASKQWSSITPHDYAADAVVLINAIKKSEVNIDGTFENGDMWKPSCRNPSYQAPAYARAFKFFMKENGLNQDLFWDNVAAKTESLFKNNAHSISGLSTNWCLPSGIPDATCSGSGTSPDKFGYDACRAPWRQGIDVLWWGGANTNQVQNVINRQADFWIKKGGATTVRGSNNLNHDGTGIGDHNGAYTGPIGAMAMGVSANISRRNFCNALYTQNKKKTMDRGYFTGILRMIGLFVQSGNFWNPYANRPDVEPVEPTISLTLDKSKLCVGSNVNFSALAEDKDATIENVEFYINDEMVFRDSVAPFSFLFKTIALGTFEVYSIAYSSDNGSVKSLTKELNVVSVPNLPLVSDFNFCKGQIAIPLSCIPDFGNTLQWYQSNVVGSPFTLLPPTPSTTLSGTLKYYVAQSNGVCASSLAEIKVNILDNPSSPQTKDLTLCQFQKSTQLTATSNSGATLHWWNSATGGTYSTLAPTPSTLISGTSTYYVSQMIANCQSSRSLINVVVNPSPVKPVVIPSGYCFNSVASPLIATGTNLKWYQTNESTIFTSTAPVPKTSIEGVQTYYVTQTVSGCESEKAEIIVSIFSQFLAPVAMSEQVFCKGSTSNQLIAEGLNLKWYSELSPDAPLLNNLINTSIAGKSTYYVSQNNGSCASERTKIEATVFEKPLVPKVKDLVYYVNDVVAPLVISGNNIRWYSSLNSTDFTSVSPIINTNQRSVNTYYLSQTMNGCEGDKAALKISVIESLTINKTAIAPIIDGVMDEVWLDVDSVNVDRPLLPSVSSRQDLSANFRMMYDDTCVYFYANITDDVKYQDSEKHHQDDSFEIYFDYDKDTSSTYDQNDVSYTFRLGTSMKVSTGKTSDGIVYQIKPIPTGYILETFIPWTKLGGLPKEGAIHGFDFHINDDDNGLNRDGKISWAADKDISYLNPSIFGRLILSGEIQICNKPEKPIILSDNLVICENIPIELKCSTNEGSNLLMNWYKDDMLLEGSTSSVLRVTEPGVYKLKVSDKYIDNDMCYTNSDSLVIIQSIKPIKPIIRGQQMLCFMDQNNLLETYSAYSPSTYSYQWIVWNASIKIGKNSSEAEILFNKLLSGGYQIGVKAINVFGCESELSTLKLIIDCPNAILESGNKKTNVAYPNPFDDVLFVKEYETYELMDLSGRVIKVGTIVDEKIDVSIIGEGVYILKVFGVNGISQQKVIKE